MLTRLLLRLTRIRPDSPTRTHARKIQTVDTVSGRDVTSVTGVQPTDCRGASNRQRNLFRLVDAVMRTCMLGSNYTLPASAIHPLSNEQWCYLHVR